MKTVIKKKMKTNSDNKQNFLIAAINDVAGNIRFLDTKVALLMATLGIIIAALVNCKGNFLFVYRFTQSNLAWHRLYLLFIFLYCVFSLLTICFSLMCIMVRDGPKLKIKSVWYFNSEKQNIKYEDYCETIQSLDGQSVNNTLSAELYKLNYINSKKGKQLKRALLSFSASCIFCVAMLISAIICFL